MTEAELDRLEKSINVREIADVLDEVQSSIEDDCRAECMEDDNEPSVDVRLQVMDDGSWDIHTGQSCYDTDHRGGWGCAVLTRDCNTMDVAAELLAEALDQLAH